jgi:hypothetical protein
MPFRRPLLRSAAFAALLTLGSLPLASAPGTSFTLSGIRAQEWTRPLEFEANQGLYPDQVSYFSRTHGFTLFLTGQGATLAFPPATNATAARRKHSPRQGLPVRPAPANADVVHLKWIGASPDAAATAEQPKGSTRYFLGKNRSRWGKGATRYGLVTVHNLYPGVDLAYHPSSGGRLEFDWRLAADADWTPIALKVEPASALHLTADGSASIRLPQGGTFLLKAPLAWQESGTTRLPVSARYVLGADGDLRLALVGVRPGLSMVIDPVLDYSTYLGEASVGAAGIAVDSAGEAIIAGTTQTMPFPGDTETTLGINGGESMVFVDKLSADGSTVLYSDFIGGSGGTYDYGDNGLSVACDPSGEAFVTGYTFSSDFPTTSAAAETYSAATAGGEATSFALKLDAAGDALVYSSYLGGSGPSEGTHIAVDASGAAYVVGNTLSSDFPIINGFGTPSTGSNQIAFISKFDAGGDTLVYSSILGGSTYDGAQCVSVDGSYRACVTGYSESPDFPVTSNALIGTYASVTAAAIVCIVDPSGDTLSYSTFLSGSTIGEESEGLGCAQDSTGNFVVVGLTSSSNFPSLNALASPNVSGTAYHGMYAYFSQAGTVATLGIFGGAGEDVAESVALDGSDTATVVGFTSSENFPLTRAFQPYCLACDNATDGGGNAFVARMALSAAPSWVYSSYLGGSVGEEGNGVAVDGNGDAYITGATRSEDFPVAAPQQATLEGSGDPFVCKLHDDGGSGTITPDWTSTPTATPTASNSPSWTVSPSPTTTYSASLTPSTTPDLTPTGTFTVTAAESPSPSPSATASASTTSPTPSPTASASTASPTPSSTASASTASPTPSSTASASTTSPTPSSTSSVSTASPTPSPTSGAPTATASRTPSFPVSASPTEATASSPGPAESALVPLPNPNPSSVAIQLPRDCDQLELRVYGRACIRIRTLTLTGAFRAGWNDIALPEGWDLALANGVYAWVAVPSANGIALPPSTVAKAFLLR